MKRNTVLDGATAPQNELFDENAIVQKLLNKPARQVEAKKSVVIEGVYALFLDRYFPGRTGKARDFVVNAIGHYLKASGVVLNSDGTIHNPSQVNIDYQSIENEGRS